MITVSATNARENLYKLIESVEVHGKRIAITSFGTNKAILISPEELASWEATMEVMSDTALMKDIKKGVEDIKAGRVISWKEVKNKAGI